MTIFALYIGTLQNYTLQKIDAESEQTTMEGMCGGAIRSGFLETKKAAPVKAARTRPKKERIDAMNMIAQSGAQIKPSPTGNLRGLSGPSAGAPAPQSFDQILEENKQIEYLLYKLAKSGAHPVPLSEVSAYSRVEDIPPEARAVLIRDLRQELHTKERLGDPSYYGSRTMEQKLRMYLQALDQIAEEIAEGEMQDQPITWAGWRRKISSEILSWGGVRP